jgi:hypothetical protein
MPGATCASARSSWPCGLFVWLELLAESKILAAGKLADLRKEVDELIAIFTSVAMKAKKRRP